MILLAKAFGMVGCFDIADTKIASIVRETPLDFQFIGRACQNRKTLSWNLYILEYVH